MMWLGLAAAVFVGVVLGFSGAIAVWSHHQANRCDSCIAARGRECTECLATIEQKLDMEPAK